MELSQEMISRGLVYSSCTTNLYIQAWPFRHSNLPCEFSTLIQRCIIYSFLPFLLHIRLPTRFSLQKTCKSCYLHFDRVSLGVDIRSTRTQHPYHQRIHENQDFRNHIFNEPALCVDAELLRGSRQTQVWYSRFPAPPFTHGRLLAPSPYTA